MGIKEREQYFKEHPEEKSQYYDNSLCGTPLKQDEIIKENKEYIDIVSKYRMGSVGTHYAKIVGRYAIRDKKKERENNL